MISPESVTRISAEILLMIYSSLKIMSGFFFPKILLEIIAKISLEIFEESQPGIFKVFNPKD